MSGRVYSNFSAWLSDEQGRRIPGSFRHGHNVVTRFGKDWLCALVRWTYPAAPVPNDGSPPLSGPSDIVVDERRLRWSAVGTGIQEEDDDVQRLIAALAHSPGQYLKALPNPTFPLVTTVRYSITYGPSAFAGASVAISEAGLFVDADLGAGHGLVTTVDTNKPVCYKRIEPALAKNNTNTLTINWGLRF